MRTEQQTTSDEAIEMDIANIEKKYGPITNKGHREELRQLFVNNMLFLYILKIGLQFESKHVSEMLALASSELNTKNQEILSQRK